MHELISYSKEIAMKILRALLVASLPVMAQPGLSRDLTIDSAVGGGIGGAVGGAVGAEVGGRNGAIIGSGVGAAVGTAIATNDYKTEEQKPTQTKVEVNYRPEKKHSHTHHCPPGQAKKGRC
jgi:outer membrane lipoprotein SlyB